MIIYRDASSRTLVSIRSTIPSVSGKPAGAPQGMNRCPDRTAGTAAPAENTVSAISADLTVESQRIRNKS
ncbi:MAG TPA: hypothetical protein PLB62_02185, partial [Candidatus Sumerlaeota bacterium]|nr:hypothetical protein [Candidatus Sumerlaeota bacterium]